MKFMTLNNKWASVFNGKPSDHWREGISRGYTGNKRKANCHPGHNGNSSSRCDPFLDIIQESIRGHQFGCKNRTSDWGMNFGMTFMGYRTEAARSYLAEWVYRVKNE
eukprot:GFKZ01007108.1.p2 GENE.GFKZ01007108.1~~GFKZ01007108.1.p2  ORF type:complete len:107 (-),score=8.11 GFKZ01007108.1:1175-1495(-)